MNQIAYLTFRPLRLGIAIAHTRFSYRLIRDEAEFTVNIPTAANLGVVQACGAMTGADGDKLTRAGARIEPATVVRSVCMADFAAHIECRVSRLIEFEERTWFVAGVVAARCKPGHNGGEALTCGRNEYRTPGIVIAAR